MLDKHNFQKLGELLIQSGLISKSQLENALEHQRRSGGRIGSILVELGYITEDRLQEVIAEKLNLPKLSLADLEIDVNVVKLLPAEVARRYTVIPIFLIGNVLTVTMDDPLNFVAIDEIVYNTKMEVKRVVATKSEIEAAIDKYYSITDTMSKTMDRLEAPITTHAEDKIVDLEKKEDISADMPAVELVDAIIGQAVKSKASDIHFEPDERNFRIRFRIDGLMREVAALELHIHQPVVSRLKVMSKIDISEKRLPQDGRFRMIFRNNPIDFRVSTMPTVFGEKVVIRILDKSNLMLNLNQMGFSESNYSKWLDVINRPEGLILITGPTGSGKTTTLYAVLSELNTPEKNIVTVEDPVEYNLPMINQVQVSEKTGLIFANALRSIVRQDPDIIMVGEIRDLATAEISIRASLTGHLVLSTLHTSDAPVAAVRLIDMGVEPYMVSTSMTAILAQRLVRVICPNCREETLPDLALVKEYMERWNLPDVTFYRGKGCPRCNNTGFEGRTAIHELMVLNPVLKDIISRKASHTDIRRAALRAGMVSLLDDGLQKASKGITTVEEVLRVCHNEDSKLEQSHNVSLKKDAIPIQI
ncbi:MAG: hypothetical protein B6D58_00955 [candidate division Zixibacteria bacterium 4484_95]|nr:MAG: hypothetical protein B6D58_00955 [candidate division Zixibacteria bacterium 4484_95]